MIRSMKYDINYNTGFVYWTDVVDTCSKIIRYDINYKKELVYWTDVVDITL